MIRPASFLDIPEIINLGNKYVEEEVKVVAHHSASWDAEQSAHNLCASLSREDLFLWVAVDEGQIVGFLWAGYHELAPWTPVRVASDILFILYQRSEGHCLVCV